MAGVSVGRIPRVVWESTESALGSVPKRTTEGACTAVAMGLPQSLPGIWMPQGTARGWPKIDMPEGTEKR